MASRKKYHVTKRPDGTRQGKAQGGQRASVVADTKKEAMADTIRIAKNKPSSQVIIHKQNGRFQEERTYNGDPYPPEG